MTSGVSVTTFHVSITISDVTVTTSDVTVTTSDVSVTTSDVSVTYLGDVEVEGITEILGLCDDEQVERPRPAEVGHDNGVHRHGRYKLPPRGFQLLQGETRLPSVYCEITRQHTTPDRIRINTLIPQRNARAVDDIKCHGKNKYLPSCYPLRPFLTHVRPLQNISGINQPRRNLKIHTYPSQATVL